MNTFEKSAKALSDGDYVNHSTEIGGRVSFMSLDSYPPRNIFSLHLSGNPPMEVLDCLAEVRNIREEASSVAISGPTAMHIAVTRRDGSVEHLHEYLYEFVWKDYYDMDRIHRELKHLRHIDASNY